MIYSGTLTKANMPKNGVFVFGSNTQGRHGLGGALVAKQQFGAIYGQPSGRQGQSYAIITKDISKKPYVSMPRWFIVQQIKTLYKYAEFKEDELFFISYSTKPNLNGWTPNEMAEMFILAAYNNKVPHNVVFEQGFNCLIQKHLTKQNDENV